MSLGLLHCRDSGFQSKVEDNCLVLWILSTVCQGMLRDFALFLVIDLCECKAGVEYDEILRNFSL